jgi:hypothetical protein
MPRKLAFGRSHQSPPLRTLPLPQKPGLPPGTALLRARTGAGPYRRRPRTVRCSLFGSHAPNPRPDPGIDPFPRSAAFPPSGQTPRLDAVSPGARGLATQPLTQALAKSCLSPRQMPVRRLYPRGSPPPLGRTGIAARHGTSPHLESVRSASGNDNLGRVKP